MVNSPTVIGLPGNLSEPARGGQQYLPRVRRLPVTDWLTLQPDVQYILNPGLEPNSDHALAVGLRFELAY